MSGTFSKKSVLRDPISRHMGRVPARQSLALDARSPLPHAPQSCLAPSASRILHTPEGGPPNLLLAKTFQQSQAVALR